MPIEFQKWITRADLRANPDKLYVFGDNVRRVGLGGQAKEMRGEPNAHGVATKYRGDMEESSFFSDGNESFGIIITDLLPVVFALQQGRTVVVPADGLGTGLSQLPQRAPACNRLIQVFFEKAVEKYNVAPHN